MPSRHLAASLVFLALLSAPMLVRLISGADASIAMERRRPAPAPTSADFADPASLPAKLSAFLEDHVGLREPLVGLYFFVRDKLDIESAALAVQGADGWLFDTLEHSLDMHEGLFPFAGGELGAWVDGARLLQEGACGAPFVVLLAPNKHTVYPEKLPDRKRRSMRPTRLEELEPALESAGVPVANPTAALREEAPRNQVFYATDTHWTAYGAFIAYRSLLDALEAQGVSTAVVGRERLSDAGTIRRSGDIPGLLGRKAEPEQVRNWVLRDPAPYTNDETLPEYDWATFKARRVRGVAGAPRLLLYGDSFSEPMIPFLRESFSEITILHHRHGRPPLSALAGCAYDAVVLEVVERALTHVLNPEVR